MITKAFAAALDMSLAELTPFSDAARLERFAHWSDVGFNPPPIVVWAGVDGAPGRLVDGRCRLEYALTYDRLDAITIDYRDFASEADAIDFVLQCARGEGKRLTMQQLDAIAALAGRPAPATYGKLPRESLERIRDGVSTAVGERRRLGLYRPQPRTRPQRDPAASPPRAPAPNVPDGHELAGQSTLTGPDGELRARWDKSARASADAPPVDIPEHHHVKRTTVMLGADGGTKLQHVSYAADEVAREKAMRAAWARHAALYAGLAGTSAPPAHNDTDTITLYPLGDPHIGMLAWAPEAGDHFDLKIACRELLACVRLMVAQAPPSDMAIITNLGDFMHAQDDTAMTPGHGNKLDVEGRFAKSLDAGHALLRGIVDAALAQHARVRVRNLPGNHDPRVAAELAMWLRAVYEREPRVEIPDAYAAQQYDRFGSCLFGWHHGDRAKPGELPAIMATDRHADWGQTEHRVWHCGHVHHLTRHETPGCVVETHRTMAAADAWHAGKYRAGRSLSAITYHREWGEVSRATVGLQRVRAAIRAGGAGATS